METLTPNEVVALAVYFEQHGTCESIKDHKVAVTLASAGLDRLIARICRKATAITEERIRG